MHQICVVFEEKKKKKKKGAMFSLFKIDQYTIVKVQHV